MSETPLYVRLSRPRPCIHPPCDTVWGFGFGGYGLGLSFTGVPRSLKNAHLPRTPLGPQAEAYSRSQEGERFVMGEVPLYRSKPQPSVDPKSHTPNPNSKPQTPTVSQGGWMQGRDRESRT